VPRRNSAGSTGARPGCRGFPTCHSRPALSKRGSMLPSSTVRRKAAKYC
jgi:hypothetical protein